MEENNGERYPVSSDHVPDESDTQSETSVDSTRFEIFVRGNLHLKGGDRLEVEDATDDPQIETESHLTRIRSKGDLKLQIPRKGSAILQVSGDLTIVEIEGKIAMQKIRGNVKARHLSDMAAEKVGGDFDLEHSVGSLALDKVGGNARIVDLSGALSVGGIGGDLRVDRVGGPIAANVGGNASLAGLSQQRVSINAGGDIDAIFSDGGGMVRVVCGGDVRIENGERSKHGPGVYRFQMGSGSASLSLSAGGNVRLGGVPVTEAEGPTISVETRFDFSDLEADLNRLGAELGSLGERIGSRIERTLNRKMRRAARRSSRGGRRSGGWGGKFSAGPVSFFSDLEAFEDVPVEEEEETSRVSDEERMTVLRMLEEGKISAAEAESLLSVLGERAG